MRNRQRKFILAFVLFLSAVLNSGAGQAGEKAKEYDFDFKQMDLSKVVSQLAKLQGKSVLFSGTIAAKTIDISLHDVTAENAMKMILENYGFVAIEKDGVFRIMTQAERGPATVPTHILTMKNILAKEIETNIKTFLGVQGSVTVNEQLNALVVSAPNDVLLEVKRLVDELDQENPQVYIEGKIVETSTLFSRKLGIEWGPSLTDKAGLMGVHLNAPSKDSTLRAGISTQIGGTGRLEASLTAGETNGDVKIISTPKITTLNGVMANFESTLTYSVKTLTVASSVNSSPGLTTSAPTSTSGLEKVKTGITLRVTPYIVSQNSIRLVVSLSKSDPDFSKTIDGIPGVSDNSANTSLIVRTGETASIGGLIHNSKSNNRSGIPFLSAIPILGNFFGSTDKDNTDRELMIFLTPTILRSGAPF